MPQSMNQNRISVLRWSLFGAALVCASAIALAPSSMLAKLAWPYWQVMPDPLLHFLGFFILGLTAWFAHAKGPWLLGALAIYAVFLEILQSILQTGRGASLWDALANGLGLAAAAVVGAAIEIVFTRSPSRQKVSGPHA